MTAAALSELTKPRRYQRAGVRMIRDFGGRAILADDMGLGKTLQAYLYAFKFLPADPPGPIVVVCNATVKGVWLRQAAEHFGFRAEVLNGRTVPAGFVADPDPNGVYIVNYDILGPVQDPAVRNRARSWGNCLADMAPRLVIVDECQNIKNRAAKRTKSVRGLCRASPRVILTSGTPLTNCPAELWPALNIVRPDLFPDFVTYGHRYCQPRLAPWGVWEYKGAENIDELNGLLRSTCMVRRTKAEVLPDLPPKIRTIVPIDVDRAGRRDYVDAETDYIAWLERQDAGRAERAARAERLNRQMELKRLAGRMKLPGVTAWAADFLSRGEDKLILFGVHKAVLGPLFQTFRRAACLITGEVTGADRDAAIVAFNTDPRRTLMIGNIQAAGTGWSASACGSVAFCELDWVPANHTQAEDRSHGIGRGRAGVPTNVYYLVAADSIEEDLCSVLQTKQGVVGSVLDGAAGGKLDLADRLDRELVRRRGSGPLRRGRRP